MQLGRTLAPGRSSHDVADTCAHLAAPAAARLLAPGASGSPKAPKSWPFDGQVPAPTCPFMGGDAGYGLGTCGSRGGQVLPSRSVRLPIISTRWRVMARAGPLLHTSLVAVARRAVRAIRMLLALYRMMGSDMRPESGDGSHGSTTITWISLSPGFAGFAGSTHHERVDCPSA